MSSFVSGIAIVGVLLSSSRILSAEAADSIKENLDLPFDVPGLSDDGEEDMLDIIVFYGQQYEGDGFFFCCDKSASMAGSKWKRLQQEVIKDIRGFSRSVQFGIVLFDSNLVAFPASGRPARATPDEKNDAIAMVEATKPGQSTCPLPALVKALAFADASTARRKVVIFISDGMNKCPGMDPATYSAAILKEVSRRNAGVQINAICLQSERVYAGEDFLRTLASENGGTFTLRIE